MYLRSAPIRSARSSAASAKRLAPVVRILRHLADAVIVAGAQDREHVRVGLAVGRELVEPALRHFQGFEPRGNFSVLLAPALLLGDLAQAEPPQHRRQRQALADEGNEDDPEGQEDDQVAMGERRMPVAVVKRQRQRRGERDDAAHAEETTTRNGRCQIG